MGTIGFNNEKGCTEHQCDSCGKVVPWSETNMFGECLECELGITEDEIGKYMAHYEQVNKTRKV